MTPTAVGVQRTMMNRATIGDQLRRHAKNTPDKPALIFYHPLGAREVYTYGSLNQRVNRLAGALAGFGVGRGDVVAVMSRNSPDYVTAYYATLKLGAALTGINFTFTEKEISYQVNHAEPKVLIVEDTFANRVAGIRDELVCVSNFLVSDVSSDDGPPEWPRLSSLVAPDRSVDEPQVVVDEDDVALLQYTSGTEAFPKAIMIPHRNYLISTTPAWQSALGITPEEIWLFLMPFFTIAGLGSMTTLTLVGATLVLVHAVDPPRALRIMEDEHVSIMAQTPTFYLAMTQVDGFQSASLPTLRRCLTYGGTVPQSMIDGWQKVNPEILWGTYWGQSELTQLGAVGWFRTLDDIPDRDPSWIGKPVPQLEVAVVDLEDNPAEIGELICRSPSVMLGYYKDPDGTSEVFRGGWLRTGDNVRIDKQGNLFFFDRKKDIIKTGGMNVSSQEVERVLYLHPGILQSAVVGLPDPYWSEAVTAFVVPKAGVELDAEEIIEFCKSEMAGFKVPKSIQIVEALPKDAQGKVLKRELRKTAANARGGPGDKASS
jgi:acyl-CoA synthetase (AMP-forming)/AMP-acid ligase II